MLAETLCDLGDWFCHLTLEKKTVLVEGQGYTVSKFPSAPGWPQITFCKSGKLQQL